LVVVQDGDFSFDILTDGDGCIAPGIIWSVGLDLVDHAFELHSQVLGKRTCFLVGQDEVQVLTAEQGAMGIMVAARCDRETAIVIFAELGQVGIGAVNIWDSLQAQFFDQADQEQDGVDELFATFDRLPVYLPLAMK
jgi:hypothetical protein